jgi:GNAT superfamily N-acetyltransferase
MARLTLCERSLLTIDPTSWSHMAGSPWSTDPEGMRAPKLQLISSGNRPVGAHQRCQDGPVEYRRYEGDDLPGVLALCEAENWPSLPADPARTHRLLTNPGVTAFVAVDDGAVVGFIYLLSDGEVQAYIALMAVESAKRRRGIGTRLIQEAFAVCGAQRVDLLSAADGFYERLGHERWVGFRLYPPFAS